MKIAYISTYSPRQCGIATFSTDLLAAIAHQDHEKQIEQHVFALSETPGNTRYPEEVKHEIGQHNLADYLAALQIINGGGYALCVLQHEYGIYGGNSGVYILSILKKLQIPLVVNLHTVLDNPSTDEKNILQDIARVADKLIVTSSLGVKLLQEVYDIALPKIAVIPHGVPDFPYTQAEAKDILALSDRKLLLTFGFLSRNKGIETVLRALPDVVRQVPDLLYIIAGKTHPNVLKHDGEEYREYLEQLVEQLDLGKHVQFDNSFMEETHLTTYLSACDIYITPYLNEAQISSGTLSFAIGAGTCVVSTPYWHAKELLAAGKGVLFEKENAQQLQQILLDLLLHESHLLEIRTAVSAFKSTLSWKKIALTYKELFTQVTQDFDGENHPYSARLKDVNPVLDLSHVKRLTNSVGIVQHATYATPNYHHGYCLDDNARALLLLLMVKEDEPTRDVDALVSTYISYIYYAQRPDGLFKNFMGFDNRFLEDIGSEDAFGRGIWAIGYLVRSHTNSSYRQIGKEVFVRAIPHFKTFRSLRAVGYIVLGLVHYLEHEPQNQELLNELRQLVSFMRSEYESNSNERWPWFEKVVSYDNAILPLALLRAYSVLHDEHLKTIAVDAGEFLDAVLFRASHLSLIGNDGWYGEHSDIAAFGQQPIEVYSTMLMYEEMYRTTNNQRYLERIYSSFQWFQGENDLQLRLYDAETGGCCDGLEAFGVNRNQGAESTITFWLSSVHMNRAFKNYTELLSALSNSSKLTVA
ncbi:glycosyltransferase family 4 protein [Sphingobacterium paludis]|uniref:Glycosyltransferase involved in cell wall biosynthesis n=1 Tax=Sphingobacterium paludis TaxID=1476465 RepID=A0A4V3E174_9SPHI|nr:glycosyltransferase family 4 protein [Sphingobacterium paludis]TDS11858.1 glycosyltransferase involved in cell wall biosynthesis [Sphingobacterium paludis]